MDNNYSIFSLNKFRKIKENAYNDKNICLKHTKKWGSEYQTNPRFKGFDHVYFHAGDETDINKYGLLPLRYVYSESNLQQREKTMKNKSVTKIFKLYKNINYNSIKNTFDYIYYKFKKGIFVIIRDNKLMLFLPFSNEKYKNNWYKQTYFSEQEKKMLQTEDYDKIKNKLNQNIIEFQKKYPEQFSSRKIDFSRDEWVGSNCNFRNQFPKYEGELVNNIFKNMLDELLKDRVIPDVEFFINNREFPILKKDFTEPYEHIFDSTNVKIEPQYQFKEMCPIFSKSITDDFADIMIPVQDDWFIASNKFFTDSCSNTYHNEEFKQLNTNWKSKKGICIFRGGATGCGITMDTNMRLKASYLSTLVPKILDAGITEWNARMKKYKGEPIGIIDTKSLPFSLSNKINNIEKSNYKYILNIEGHVAAFRLSYELGMNSVVLIVASKYKVWYSSMLEEYVHYVPVKEDLSDLIDQINWCIKNDKKCEKIAENARLFFTENINKKGIFNYLEKKLLMINTNKNYKNLLGIKKSKKKIAYITCFRDSGNGERIRERKMFIQIMNKILEPYFDFHIYIIEQSDDGEKFNIGKLKNIGFEIASKEMKFDNYIFSDIDTIPDYDLMDYFKMKLDGPIALAIRGTRYEIIDKKIDTIFLGALLGFNDKIFKNINGYPNNFYGWGGEDDSLQYRLINNKYDVIYYPNKGSTIDIEDYDMKQININEKMKVTIKDNLKLEKLIGDTKTWNNNGLNSLNYKIIEKNIINRNTSQIKVDLMKKYDEKKYPELYTFRNNMDYNELKRKIRNTYGSIKLNKKYI